MAWQLRRQRYDVVFNLHGGTTATFLTAATRARHRVGLTNYQYSFLYNHLLSSPIDYWQRKEIHSTEQQLALLGFAGVPVDDLPKSRLTVTAEASRSLAEKFLKHGSGPLSEFGDFVLIHPTAAFATKQWDTAKFAQTAEFLYEKKLKTIAVAANFEASVLSELVSKANIPIAAFHDLTLPEITSLASQARLFVGNDSGIAHIAAAVNTPSVVIFGSSNRVHWRPWTEAPNEIVYEAFPCQPCPGYVCAEYGEPRCILTVPAESVFGAIDRVLSPKK